MSGGALWLPSEDALLIRLYGRGHPRKEITARLGRSIDAVDARRRAVGCKARTQRRPWQPREDELLRAARTAAIPASEVAPRLGRSIEAVRLRNRQLGLSRTAARPYSAADDRTLRRCWDDGVGLAHLPRELGRSADALRLRARQLGLASPPRRHRWRPEDDRLLREGYAQGLSCAAIAATLLPERTAGGIAARAALLGLAIHGRRWTKLDDRELAALAPRGCPLEEAARRLQRTPEAIRRRARTRGLGPLTPERHAHANRPWRPDEDELLRRALGADLALLTRRLGRSDHAIRRRIDTLGLRAGRERSPHRAPTHATKLSVGERRLVLSALETGGGKLLALSRRLGQPPGKLRRNALAENGHEPPLRLARPPAQR